MKSSIKNSRGGKRTPSCHSFSSSASTAAILISVSLFIFAVYTLTSSSSSLLSFSMSSPVAEEDSPQIQNGENRMEEDRENENRLELEDEISIEEQRRIREIDWDLCNLTAGPDYIPCLDNAKAVKKLKSLQHYEHRERHCPEESPACLVPLPEGYKRSIEWPASRDKVFYSV